MRIENEPKLDFKDVLFRPKRSTLGSRAKVELRREYRFRHVERRAVDHSSALIVTIYRFASSSSLPTTMRD